MRRKRREDGGLSALQLILIITGSIVAAVGIIMLIMKFCYKKGERKSFKNCCCDDIDGWEFDDDLLDDLRFDDSEECDCGCDFSESEPEVSEEISAAVDEAIEAISSITEDEKAE